MKRSNKVTILGAVFVMNVTVLFLLLMQLFLKKWSDLSLLLFVVGQCLKKLEVHNVIIVLILSNNRKKTRGRLLPLGQSFFGTEPPLPLHQFQLSDTFFLVRFRWIEVLGRTMKESWIGLKYTFKKMLTAS